MPPTATAVTCTVCGNLFPASDNRARCARCRQARQPSDWQRRRDIADSRFPSRKRRELLARVAAGEPLPDACDHLGLTQHRVWGWTAFDEMWGPTLDDALTEGRDPDLAHGTAMAYRWGRCRCPECRQWRRDA